MQKLTLPSRKYESIEKRAGDVFASYGSFDGKEQPSRSFVLREDKGKGKHFLGPIFVTWSRGNISVAGDAGEITLTHYYAMPTFEEAMDWLATAHVDYLLGKSNAVKALDREETWRDMVRWVNEEEINFLQGLGRRRYDDPPTRERAWNRLAAHLDDHSSRSMMRIPYMLETLRAAHRRQVKEILWEFLSGEAGPVVETFVYDFTEDGEMTAAHSYKASDLFKISLLRDFARNYVAKRSSPTTSRG